MASNCHPNDLDDGSKSCISCFMKKCRQFAEKWPGVRQVKALPLIQFPHYRPGYFLVILSSLCPHPSGFHQPLTWCWVNEHWQAGRPLLMGPRNACLEGRGVLRCGALDRGSPMSHVDLKKWQGRMSLSLIFQNVTCRI